MPPLFLPLLASSDVLSWILPAIGLVLLLIALFWFVSSAVYSGTIRALREHDAERGQVPAAPAASPGARPSSDRV